MSTVVIGKVEVRTGIDRSVCAFTHSRVCKFKKKKKWCQISDWILQFYWNVFPTYLVTFLIIGIKVIVPFYGIRDKFLLQLF